MATRRTAARSSNNNNIMSDNNNIEPTSNTGRYTTKEVSPLEIATDDISSSADPSSTQQTTSNTNASSMMNNINRNENRLNYDIGKNRIMPRGWLNPLGPMNVKSTANRDVVVDVAVHPTWDRCSRRRLIQDVDVYT